MRCIFNTLSTLVACLCLLASYQVSAYAAKDEIVTWLAQFYELQGRPQTTAQTAQQLNEALFLLEQAKQVWPTRIARENQVGFSTSVQQKRFVNALSESVLSLNCEHTNTKEMQLPLATLLGSYPVTGTLSKNKLDELAHYNVAEAYSLATLYQDASVQLKMRLHQGDLGAARELITQHECYLQYKHKWQQTTPFVELEYAALALIIAPSMKHYFGVAELLHGEPSAHVLALKKRITDEEITHYYQANKNEFRYLQSVKANIKEFKTRQAANAYIKAPSAIFELIVTKAALNQQFAYQAAFNISPKQGWVVLRSPNQTYLAVRTVSQTFEYYLPSSETVRYQAITALTKLKAKQEYMRMFSQWQNSNTRRL